MAKDAVTIFHNPGCGTSRAVLATLRKRGADPKVVEYLKTGWTRPKLEALFAAMNTKPRCGPIWPALPSP